MNKDNKDNKDSSREKAQDAAVEVPTTGSAPAVTGSSGGAPVTVHPQVSRSRPAGAGDFDLDRRPQLFETSSGLIVLADVSSVQCYASAVGNAGCEVVLRSGVKVNIDLQYSRPLIQAVKDHHAEADGAPVRVATAPMARVAAQTRAP
jgi:hypothetical protein